MSCSPALATAAGQNRNINRSEKSMNIQTRGIILKQIKLMNDRRMLMMFSEEKGKISVSASQAGSGKKRAALAYRPFTLGRYELYRAREIYSIQKAETLRSYFSIGEDIDKYLYASYALEFTEKLLPEEAPAPGLFSLLTEFFSILEKRPGEYLFLVRAYQLKAIQCCGYGPSLSGCVICGKPVEDGCFSVKAGGLVCPSCRQDIGLILQVGSDIIEKIKYILKTPLKKIGKLYLDQASLKAISQLILQYLAYHMDIRDLKSEAFLSTDPSGAERK